MIDYVSIAKELILRIYTPGNPEASSDKDLVWDLDRITTDLKKIAPPKLDTFDVREALELLEFPIVRDTKGELGYLLQHNNPKDLKKV